MKKILLTIITFVIASHFAFANPALTINKADNEFLFNGTAKTITLSNNEMVKTEGERWGWVNKNSNTYYI